MHSFLRAGGVFILAALPGVAFAQSSGGPDNGGYRWSTTTFAFDDVSSQTRLDLGDDEVSGGVDLPFLFDWYGSQFSAVYVSSNGFLSFIAGQPSSPSAINLPNSNMPNATIAPFWGDLFPPGGSGRIYFGVLGTAPNRRAVVSWENVPVCCGTSNPSSFQVVLYETTNQMDIRCRTCDAGGAEHATGFESDGGTNGLSIRNVGVYSLNNTAFRVTPPAEPTSGGPDDGGYRWDEIAYSYESIANTNGLALGDDQVSDAIPIGFDFAWYEGDHSEVYISSNGFITFLANQYNGCCQGERLPGTEDPVGIISAFWGDLYPPGGGNVWYATRGTAPDRRFIVEWENMPICCGTTNRSTFQIVLYEANSTFEIRCQSCDPAGRQRSTGFANQPGDIGLSIRFGAYALTERAFRGTPPSRFGAGGPYRIAEGGSRTLRGACDGCTVFDWDFDSDGQFDDATGARPAYSAAGTDGPSMRRVLLRACIAANTGCTTYTGTVSVTNAPPTITSIPPAIATVGREMRYAATASDPAGVRDPISWSIVMGPFGAQIDPISGVLSWTPEIDFPETFIIEASDGDGGTAVQMFDVDIEFRGPDRFGYVWEPQDNYVFEDLLLEPMRTDVPLGDDELFGPVMLPFAFNYYGTPTTELFISSNGFITFNDEGVDGCCEGVRVSDSNEPNGFIAGYWSDLDPGASADGVSYFSTGTAPNRTFLVQWSGVPSARGDSPSTFQIVLYEGRGDFEVRCAECVPSVCDEGDGGPVLSGKRGCEGDSIYEIGFENQDGDDGLNIRNGTVTAIEQSWRAYAPSTPMITDTEVTPRTQPERAEFLFIADRPGPWTVELTRRINNACTTTVVDTLVLSAASFAEGAFVGLSPGGSYCWTVTVGLPNRTATRSGNFTIPALPGFTAGPAATPSGQDMRIDATISTSATGVVRYTQGACSTVPTGIQMTGSQVAAFPGDIMPRNAFTFEAWIRPTVAMQDRILITGYGGNVQAYFDRGMLNFAACTDDNCNGVAATNPIAANTFAHVAMSYDGALLRLWIDGVLLDQQPLIGLVLRPEDQSVAQLIGDLVGNTRRPYTVLGYTDGQGFIGGIYSAAIYSRTLTTAEVQAHFNAGPGVELAALNGRVAGWFFDEAQGVQSIYDSSGNHNSGILGETTDDASDDPVRLPAFPGSQALGTGTMLTATLSGLPQGTYCYRAEAALPNGGPVIASTLRTFTRAGDTVPPVITVAPTFITECTGNASAQVTLQTPTVMDNLDPSPVVRPLVAGNAITFPFTFPLGDTVVRWTATDAGGNTATADQTVRVRDTQAPVVTGGTELVIEATGSGGSMVTPVPQSATDSCSMVTTTNNGPALYPLGVTRVVFTVSDSSNNRTTASRDVRLVDTTAPSFAQTPLPALTIASDGTGCLAFAPPLPAVSDNGWPADRLSVSVAGVPACWTVGTFTLTWTVRDPSGNERTATQTVNVVPQTLNVSLVGLESRGNTVQPGRYYDSSVTVIFTVSGGTAPYTVTLQPAPADLSNTGNTYRARYDAAGAYPTVLVLARDNGTGAGTLVTSFGIDLTPPVIESDIVPQSGVTLGNTATYPVVFVGETLDLPRITARDGTAEPPNLRGALVFNGASQLATIPDAASIDFTAAFSAQAWVRPERIANQVVLYKSRGGATTTPGYAIELDDRGRVIVRARIGNADVEVVGPMITTGAWHHLAATYDGRALRLWIDGKPAELRYATGALDSGRGPLYLGGRAGTDVSLRGRLSEVALWSGPLGERDVVLLYAGGAAQAVTPGRATVAIYHLDDTGQVIADASGRNNPGLLGATAVAEPDDPSLSAASQPVDRAASGVVRLTVTVREAPNGAETTILDVTRPAAGTPLATGPRMVGGEVCAAAANGPCTAGEPDLRAEVLWMLRGMREAAYHLEVRATDAAGNSATRSIAFRTKLYETQLQDSGARMGVLLMDPLNIAATNELQAAQQALEVALSYATMNVPYDPGSYLKADNALESLTDAIDLNVDAGDQAELLGRATVADVRRYVDSLGTGLVDEDRPIWAAGEAWLLDARFERAALRHSQSTAAAREGLEAVDLLYPPYQAMRRLRRQVNATWNAGLASFAAGSTTAEALRTDPLRFQQAGMLMTATRDALRDSIYAEITAVRANRFTTQQTALAEIQDVIAKDSNVGDEVGDLIQIGGSVNSSACIDLLANFRLDDNTFARCYLRLNDMVRTLDRVSEPLVTTTRWRAGVNIALFNMLELSMNVSPTGLPWATTRVAPVMGAATTLVLPDARAASVPRSIPVSMVDTPARDIATGYQRYADAQALLLAGDVDGAFVVFRDNRCLLLGLFNTFYSTRYMLDSVADPKDPPIDPASVGCPP